MDVGVDTHDFRPWLYDAIAYIMREKQRLGRCPQITSNPGTRVQSQARISDRDATTSENWEFPPPLRGEVVP